MGQHHRAHPTSVGASEGLMMIAARATSIKVDDSPAIGCSPSPLGATVVDGGVNFSVYSRHATAVELLLFDHDNDPKPARTIAIDPISGRTYHYWHIREPGLKPGQLYAYRAHG